MKQDSNSMTNTQVRWIVVLFIFVFASSGYLYNNAERQAKDIKACQSVNANWRYNSFNQVLCVPKKKRCDE